MSNVLGIVPARGGSKGVPDKNLRRLAGRPLLAYSVDSARASGVLDRLILSTDSRRIAAIGRELGVEVPFMRPTGLAADDTPMVAVLEHALGWLEEQEGWVADLVVLLQPTTPLRRPGDVAEAVRILRETACDSVASVVEVPRHLSPDYVMRIEDGRLVNFLPEGRGISRRQDARRAYSRDGTVYAFRRETLLDKGSIYGDDCRPLLVEESVTIDTPEDWAAAERALSGRDADA